MIDTNKNTYYLIYSYWTTKRGNKGQVKFLSRHSISSKRFKEFKSNYFKNVLGIGEKRMKKGYDGTTDEQFTLSHSLEIDLSCEQVCY